MKSNTRKTTPRKTDLPSNRSQSSNTSLTNSLYFCHYRNAMYMGGIKTFQKHGSGILLHDKGMCVISNYYNDFLHGHNIFFMNRCLISSEWNKNKLVEAVYRTDGFLLSLIYNADGLLDGKCVLLNYVTRSIMYIMFKRGVLVDKKDEK